MKLKTKLSTCASLALLLLPFVLTGCASVSPGAGDSRRLYQAPVLRLPAAKPVQTKDGVYLPQVDEVWHSDARYRDLERAYLDLVTAKGQTK